MRAHAPPPGPRDGRNRAGAGPTAPAGMPGQDRPATGSPATGSPATGDEPGAGTPPGAAGTGGGHRSGRKAAAGGGAIPAPAHGTTATAGEPRPPQSTGRRRRWLRLAGVATGLAVVSGVVIVGRRTLARSVTDLGHLDWRWFALSIVFEVISLSAFGLSRRRLLRADGHQADFGSVMAITYAGNALSMSVPFAGAQLAAVFSYRQFRRRGLDPAITGWALGVSAIASTSALALMLVVGALASGAPLATAAGFLGAAIFLLPGVTVLLALRYRRARAAANRALAWVLRAARRLLRKPSIDPAALEGFLDRLAGFRLPPGRYAEVFGLAVVNWVADCAALACSIRAAGAPVPWSGLILAYGAGAAAGSTGLTPGGFALVEVTLTAALVAAGMNAAAALTGVLAYRLVNFWLILLGGGIAMFVLTRVRGRLVRPYPRPGRKGPLGTTGGDWTARPAQDGGQDGAGSGAVAGDVSRACRP